MKCQKCGQPLEPWEAGLCEGCGMQKTRSHTKKGITVTFNREGCFLTAKTPKGDDLRIQTQRFSGWEVVLTKHDGDERSLHKTQRAALSRAVDLFIREQHSN